MKVLVTCGTRCIGWLRTNKRLVDAVAILLTLIPVYFVLRLAFDAVFFPMELDVREGASWMHVLFQSAGISIFDHTQVATNGAHGPVDHLFKTWLHILIPALPSNAVIRMYVGLLPFCLFAMTYGAASGLARFRVATALMAAALIYVCMANLKSYNLLVGRPDPSVLCFLALQGMMTARYFYRGKASLLSMALYSLLMSLAFFDIWRIAPTIFCLWIIAAISVAKGSARKVAEFLGIAILVFSATFIFFLFYEFMGSLKVFYDHMYNMFMNWAFTYPYVPQRKLADWEVFPTEIISSSTIRMAVFAPLGVLFLSLFCYGRKGNKIYVVNFLLCVFIYVFFSYGYFKGKDGGGLYYFSPYLLFCGLCGLLTRARVKRPAIFSLALALLLIVVPDWGQVEAQTQNLENNREAAAKFRSQLEKLDASGEIMSETYHLYKVHIGDSTVDCGDNVKALADMNFYGPEYSATALKFYDRIKSGRYAYFFTGGIESKSTTDYLQQNYERIGAAPPFDTMNAPGGCHSLVNCPIVWRKKR